MRWLRHFDAPREGAAGRPAPSLAPVAGKLEARRTLRIVFLNDYGFAGGAGIGLMRQVESFLLGGHDVAVVCHHPDDFRAPRPPRQRRFGGSWLGIAALADGGDATRDAAAQVERVASAVATHRPDLVIVGNLHGAPWPLRVLDALPRRGLPVVAYLHDCHFVTGRCAAPRACEKFAGGCDHTCPTPDEYPALAPPLIADAWAERQRLFRGDAAIPVVANSRWTAGVARGALGASGHVSLIHLGLDTTVFAPIDRAGARKRLGFAPEGLIAIAGAVFIKQEWKGFDVLRAVIDRLGSGSPVRIVAFGHESDTIPGIDGLGWIGDPERLALAFNAADMMLNCANAEAFGQTLLEAAACALPIVATRVGGITDTVIDGANGILVDPGDAEGLAAGCRRLAADPQLRRRLGRRGRRHAERHFTLDRQYAAWRRYLATAGAG
ncbi:MAG: glycosyltransferase [Rhodospirillaceae bacterium]|nr:glycosyltransferase [Rhodospirillaceae bacterium]